MDKQWFLALAGGSAFSLSGIAAAMPETPTLELLLEEAADLEPIQTIIVAKEGEIVAERGYHGISVTSPTNIKSASKSIVSALVGMAIDRGVLQGPDQKIVSVLADDLPLDADPRINEITIGNLLSMQAGLGRTSGANYGRWVSSENWVRAALAMPFEEEPGGPMLYSTGSTHLLSAILASATRQSTLELARDWLGSLDGFSIDAWDRDPQGVYLGGNQMAMSPRSLLAFGELYRRGGVTSNGERLLSADWIEMSWQRRTNSRFHHDDAYGYGWFLTEMAGEETAYAWGYGGQMLYIVPALDLTVVMTSDENSPSGRTGHRDDLNALMAGIIETMRGTASDGP